MHLCVYVCVCARARACTRVHMCVGGGAPGHKDAVLQQWSRDEDHIYDACLN